MNDVLSQKILSPSERGVIGGLASAAKLSDEQRAKRASAAGLARAKKLSPERRKEISLIAAKASQKARQASNASNSRIN